MHDRDVVTGGESAVIIVRAWRQNGRVIVRMLASSTNAARPHQERVATSIDAACDELRALLAPLVEAPPAETER